VSNDYPVSIDNGEWDRGLWWMVLVSGGLHLVVMTVVLLMPKQFLHHPPPLVSYSVDLVAPDRIGGSNVVQGGKGRVEGAPLVAAAPAPKVEAPKPPPPKVEAKPEPPQPPEQAEPKPPEPPKVEIKPKEDEMALAEKAKPPSPPAAPTAGKRAPSPQAQPQPSPKVVAKAEPPKPQPAPQPKVDAKAVADAKKAAEAKATADAKAAKEAAAAKQRDEQITAAIRRVEQRTGVRGGGTGSKIGDQPGGPISVGPGEGTGGTIKGVEYLLYYNQLLNRIKQSWAWAGTARALEAVVRFNVTENGEVVNVRITQPSGDASYDASVERAVRAVNPLPPPPETYRKEFSDVELTFNPEQMQP
jgi:colicin import membrane protein